MPNLNAVGNAYPQNNNSLIPPHKAKAGKILWGSQQNPGVSAPAQKGLNHIASQKEHSASEAIDLSRFTTWGNGLSCGRIIGDVLRLPGKGLEVMGGLCESSKWQSVKSFGTGVKFLGVILGIPGCFVGQIITVTERLLLNSLKGLGGLTLMAVGALAMPFGNASVFDRGVTWLKDAWMTRGEVQEKLGLGEASKQQRSLLHRMNDNLWSVLAENNAVLKDKVPEKWRKHYQPPKDAQDSGRISGLSVAVGVQFLNDEVFISFLGVHDVRSATTALLCALGAPDDTFLKAQEIVQDFAAMYPGKVRVIGHSLGGALAQYSGIKAGVPVTCFNGMGLPARMVDELVSISDVGQNKLKQARVEHFNSGNDWLAQKLQTRFAPFGLSQLGHRYKVSNARGHQLEDLSLVM